MKFACEAGKHIFCEMPIATTFHDADQVGKSTQKSPAKFQVGYQRRFDPPHVKIKETLESGEMGSIVLVKSNTRDPLPNPTQWPDLKNSGGIFVDTCSHDYDVVRWLCGSEVSRVEAEVLATVAARPAHGHHEPLDGERGDGPGGGKQDVKIRLRRQGRGARDKGAIFTRPDAPARMRAVKGPKESLATYTWYADRFKEAYRLEMESFIDSIVTDAEPKVTAQDGKAAVEVATAARKSMQEGKAVNLPL